MDCTIEDDGPIVLVINEWVGKCPIQEEQILEQWSHGQVPRLLNGLSTSHQQWYTDKLSQWMDLSRKWSCVRSNSTGTRIATCQLSRAGAASWVDFTNNQSTLTAACSCCACRSILHDIVFFQETCTLPPWCHLRSYCGGCMDCLALQLRGSSLIGVSQWSDRDEQAATMLSCDPVTLQWLRGERLYQQGGSSTTQRLPSFSLSQKASCCLCITGISLRHWRAKFFPIPLGSGGVVQNFPGNSPWKGVPKTGFNIMGAPPKKICRGVEISPNFAIFPTFSPISPKWC